MNLDADSVLAFLVMWGLTVVSLPGTWCGVELRWWGGSLCRNDMISVVSFVRVSRGRAELGWWHWLSTGRSLPCRWVGGWARREMECCVGVGALLY